MKFNWTWQETAFFSIVVIGAVALIITHNATWRELAAFAAGTGLLSRPIAADRTGKRERSTDAPPKDGAL